MQQTQPTPKLALIEDDPDQRESLLAWLELNNYPIWAVDSAENFYRQFAISPVDVLIIDLGLPGEDGQETIRHIRQYARIGIIVVSARSSVDDRLTAIQNGADQYLVKPIVPEELLLYINTLWQRITESFADTTKSAWVLLAEQRKLQAPNGETIALTPSEMMILDYLSKANTVVHREDIVHVLGGDPKSFSMHRIDAHLSRLRNKVKACCGMTLPIKPLPGARLEFNGTLLCTR